MKTKIKKIRRSPIRDFFSRIMTKQKIEMLSPAATRIISKQTSNAMNIPSSVGRNADGKRVIQAGSTSEERAYQRSLCRFVDTTEYSMDMLVGKMSRLSLEDKRAPEEVIVWKGNYIVCD